MSFSILASPDFCKGPLQPDKMPVTAVDNRVTVKPNTDTPNSVLRVGQNSSESLLETIATDHYKKYVTDTMTMPVTSLTTSSTDFGNPLGKLAVKRPLDMSEEATGESSPLPANPLRPATRKPENLLIQMDTSPIPVIKSETAPSLEELSSQFSALREQSPTSLSNNPLLGRTSKTGLGGFSGNPLLGCGSTHTPKMPLMTSTNGLIKNTTILEANPLLSLSMKPIIPMSRPVDINVQLRLEERNNNTILKDVLKPKNEEACSNPGSINKSPPNIPQLPPLPPPSMMLPSKYRPKPKFEYDSAFVSTKKRKALEEPEEFPEPFDETLFDRSLVKEKPSWLGSRFSRRPTNSTHNSQENELPHQKIWKTIYELFPGTVFKFNTPSPDTCTVGNTSDRK